MKCSFKPYEGKEKYIFISYSHKDCDKVFPILDYLNNKGFRIWYDEGIEWGSEWPDSIAEHLSRSEICIIFHSANSIGSINCRQEIYYALKEGKGILSVYLEDVDLSSNKGLDMQLSSFQSTFMFQYENLQLFYERLENTQLLQCCREKNNLKSKEKDLIDSINKVDDKKSSENIENNKENNKKFSNSKKAVKIVLAVIVLATLVTAANFGIKNFILNKGDSEPNLALKNVSEEYSDRNQYFYDLSSDYDGDELIVETYGKYGLAIEIYAAKNNEVKSLGIIETHGSVFTNGYLYKYKHFKNKGIIIYSKTDDEIGHYIWNTENGKLVYDEYLICQNADSDEKYTFMGKYISKKQYDKYLQKLEDNKIVFENILPELTEDALANETKVQEYILIGSDTKYILKSELQGFTVGQCWLARNEIYARHGRMFDDEYLQKYFNSKEWYTPTIDPDKFDESLLNSYEVANLDLIVRYEKDVLMNETKVQEYILIGSDSKYILKSELQGFTAGQCWLARNEIYARHGRMFNDEYLQEYFNSKEWYTPTIDPDKFDESSLNSYEVANLNLIVEYEKECGYR